MAWIWFAAIYEGHAVLLSCIFKWLLAFCKTFPEPASIVGSSCKQITYFSINRVKTAGALAIYLMVQVQSSSMQSCSHSVHSYQLLAENSQHSHTLIVRHIQWLFCSTNPPGLLQFSRSLVTCASSIAQQNTQGSALVMFGRTEKILWNVLFCFPEGKKCRKHWNRAVWETARKGDCFQRRVSPQQWAITSLTGSGIQCLRFAASFISQGPAELIAKWQGMPSWGVGRKY